MRGVGEHVSWKILVYSIGIGILDTLLGVPEPRSCERIFSFFLTQGAIRRAAPIRDACLT